MGDVSDEVARAFFTLSGSMIHDLYGLRLMLGNPTRVVSTEVWQGGRAMTDNFAICIGGAVRGYVDRFARFVAF